MCRSCSQHWTQISKHLILAILASFLPPLLFLTHLRGWWLTLWLVTDIMVGDWHMMKLCARRPFKLSNFGTCQLVPLQPRPSFWAPVHQQELHPNPPPPILQGRPASSCCSTCVFGHVLSIWSLCAHISQWCRVGMCRFFIRIWPFCSMQHMQLVSSMNIHTYQYMPSCW